MLPETDKLLKNGTNQLYKKQQDAKNLQLLATGYQLLNCTIKKL